MSLSFSVRLDSEYNEWFDTDKITKTKVSGFPDSYIVVCIPVQGKKGEQPVMIPLQMKDKLANSYTAFLEINVLSITTFF